MKNKYQLAMIIPFVLLSSLYLAPTEAKADKVKLEQPKIFIDNKGKVDMKSDDGTIKSKQSLVTEFLTKYRVVVAGISGIGTTSMILFFIIGFIRLGATSDNPEGRSKTIIGLVCSGIGAAGLGVVTLITGIFMNAL